MDKLDPSLLKFLKRTAFTLSVLVICDAGIIYTFSITEPVIGKADAIVILGAAIHTPALINRTLNGLELWEAGKAPLIVASGGRRIASDPAESEEMKHIVDQNTSATVPMILDTTSRNTYENIRNVKAAIPEANSIIIVSDRFHLARAVILAKAAGFQKVYWSAPDPDYYRSSEYNYYYLREMAAMVAYLPKILSLTIHR
jgi:uncharacterized SAM-binding protein YcdF (DUF218 family)